VLIVAILSLIATTVALIAVKLALITPSSVDNVATPFSISAIMLL
jgi:hypothetical protein